MAVYLFDLFYTLVGLLPNEWEHESAYAGISMAQWERCVTDSGVFLGRVTEPMDILRENVRCAGKTVSEEIIEKMCRQRVARVREIVTQVRPEILSTLRALKERGHRLCLVSNADCIDAMHWGESPLAPLFDEAIFSCQVGMIKPEPGIYRLAARRMGVSPGDCVFVGDGGSGELAGARAVGMRTIQVRHIARRSVEGADYIVDNFRDILTTGEHA
jgi:putative hydrolase of the HAD superfamily